MILFIKEIIAFLFLQEMHLVTKIKLGIGG